MTLSDEQIQELLRVGNPTDEECRLIRMGWGAALARVRTQGVPDGWKLMPIEPTQEIYKYFAAYDGSSYSNPFDFDDFREDYLAAINSTELPVGAKGEEK